MFFRRFLIINFCLLLLCSCTEEQISNKRNEPVYTEKFANGNVKFQKFKIFNDSIDYNCESFYPSSTIEQVFSTKGGLIHGYFKCYYQNGKIDFEGPFISGRKKGFFKYYDSTGRLEKMINFINYRDSSIARPNEVIRFDKQGDTLYYESYFYNFYRKADTLKSSEGYQFKFISRGKLFKYSYIVFCNLDDKFNKIGADKPISVLMENNQIELSKSENKIGTNYLTGYILNTNTPISTDGHVAGLSIEMYFIGNIMLYLKRVVVFDTLLVRNVYLFCLMII